MLCLPKDARIVNSVPQGWIHKMIMREELLIDQIIKPSPIFSDDKYSSVIALKMQQASVISLIIVLNSYPDISDLEVETMGHILSISRK